METSLRFISNPFFFFNNPTLTVTKPLFTNFLSFPFIHSKKNHNFPNSSSHSNHSYIRNQRSKDDNHNFLPNPIWVLLPLLQSVKLEIFSKPHKTLIENGNYLQNGSIGIALLSITASAKHRISPFVATLATNSTFVSGLVAWFFAQSMKVLLNFIVEKKWDLRILFSCGGMSSSHSALCMALTTSVAICHGVSDSLFPVCLGFSLIVMYDAIGVRRHAGMQAEVLNLIVEDLFEGHPISKRKLKELLGHTPLQVVAGALLGIVVAWYCCQGSLIPC